MTEKELAELERLEKKATPGPWYFDDGVTDGDRLTGERGKTPWVTTFKPYRLVCCPESGLDESDESYAITDANGDFIAASRMAIPALIAEIRKLRTQIKQMEDDPDLQLGRITRLESEIKRRNEESQYFIRTGKLPPGHHPPVVIVGGDDRHWVFKLFDYLKGAKA